MDAKRRSYFNQFHSFQFNRERYFAPKLYKALKLQYQQFLTAYTSGKSVTDSLMSVSSAPIYNTLKPLYIDAGVNYGSKIYASLPKAPKKTKRRGMIGFDKQMIDLINAYFDEPILNTSEGITTTTRELIQVVMQIANEEGRGTDWIVEQLTIESDQLNNNRARLVARTETVTATNQAAWFAAAKTGLKMNKEWLSTQDNRTRTTPPSPFDHLSMNGFVTGFSGYFDVSDEWMLVPGAKVQENGLPTSAGNVCNCRCTCLYVPVKINGKYVEIDYGVWPVLEAA